MNSFSRRRKDFDGLNRDNAVEGFRFERRRIINGLHYRHISPARSRLIAATTGTISSVTLIDS